ncbi:DUF938 domain-containing protein [Lysobacter silvisoli]|uniref:DUF938 domain-containing protein n=1 Tax=Lysobacter silvisoli TaxID=2293254 RepID=A0A371JYB9_9GAMM|nr:DUF938 domain-containing protein [Lysobacter silvisoli]RDZ26656.1 DUF938 domain-containing protein [Lysobacter silvisoli]
MTDLPYAPACDRNRDPILEVLRAHLPAQAQVLEIGSGTGQHAVHFAAAVPGWTWQCSDRAEKLPGIRAWLAHASLANTPPPFELYAVTEPVPGLMPPRPPIPLDPVSRRSGYDVVYSANTLHIMGWPQAQALFAALPTLLADDSRVVVYGPFKAGGEYLSQSDLQFDAILRERDAASGLRDIEAVLALAESAGLRLIDRRAMPAHNHCLVWRR